MNEIAVMTTPPPTKILVGAEDVATPVPRAQAMQNAIRGARLDIIPEAGHSSPIENPHGVSDILIRFLDPWITS